MWLCERPVNIRVSALSCGCVPPTYLIIEVKSGYRSLTEQVLLKDWATLPDEHCRKPVINQAMNLVSSTVHLCVAMCFTDVRENALSSTSSASWPSATLKSEFQIWLRGWQRTRRLDRGLRVMTYIFGEFSSSFFGQDFDTSKLETGGNRRIDAMVETSKFLRKIPRVATVILFWFRFA